MELSIDGNLCYVASEMAGLEVLDVSTPSVPDWIGDLSAPYNQLESWSVVARDSFAYAGWRIPYLRSVDVSDPTQPRLAGAANVTAVPEDMELRDTLLYVAEDGVFEVVNVAGRVRPWLWGRARCRNGLAK